MVVGETCLSQFHRPDTVTVNKTYLLRNGRSSICKPCPNNFEIKEELTAESFDTDCDTPRCDSDIFVRRNDDDTVGLSVEDKEFLCIMDQTVSKNTQGYWEAPLPFRSPRRRLPDNRTKALQRAKSLDFSLRKDDAKKGHFLEFMQRIFENNHAEIAPPLTDGEEAWYLPIFGVYHPKKPTQIRVVFDSSAKYDDVSLNDVLMTGPDLINSLLGVLLRFRKDLVAVTADIQQMFYCFVVSEKHRNFLRFFWYEDNNPEKELVEYRMRVHVFGNSPSPAVATYGLRKAAQSGEGAYGSDVVSFVKRNFYVDDGLVSLPTASDAIDLMKRTQEALMEEGNLRLHKIASNSQDVMNAFSKDDKASHLKDIDLGVSEAPMQRSLGLYWNLQSDSFTYRTSLGEKPFSKRGILSVVNSLYDPLGFIAPVVILGKLLLRDLMASTKNWDEPLPEIVRDKWERWKNSLLELDQLSVPRTYATISWKDMIRKEVHIYCDASEKAIAAVAFLKTTDTKGGIHVGYVMGKAKVAPLHGHSIPRLELCAAVLAVQISETICKELDLERNSFHFFSDSKVVLGYIHNSTRRFYMYVTNRVAKIRKLSQPHQWSYVNTESNPADAATRYIPPDKLQKSMWLQGPPTLYEPTENSNDSNFPLVNVDQDKEIRPQVQVLKTELHENTFALTHRIERFSVWRNLVNTLKRLKLFSRTLHKDGTKDTLTDISYNATVNFIIRQIQSEVFLTEISCIKHRSSLPKTSRIRNLNPFLDDDGMLRVGGRIHRADIEYKEKHPIIIPGNNHIAVLLIRHYHYEVKHQGRHFTAGALRDAGFWIVGERRLISSLLYKCVICRRLRGKQEQQLMSDLPEDRVSPSPPFSSVGIDAFGPWSVVTRKTRGGQANSKRWALLFTCLSTRAIHIEVIEELSSSSFINALRRFIALRGSVKEIRSDRGTNFVGSVDHLDVNSINVEEGPVHNFLEDKQTVWIFNPPHSSHMGGIWERMIGITRRILDSMILEVQSKDLTHEVLTTFLAEVCAIVNGRPIVPVSSDPESPLILSPAMILTQKSGCYPAPIGTFDMKDMYKAQWRRVQYLADTFWQRWNKEYLHTLQTRRKWKDSVPNLKRGDIVLLRDKTVSRNEWPTGTIVNPLPGQDGRVRKAEVRVTKNGSTSTYTRPISEMVLLLSV